MVESTAIDLDRNGQSLRLYDYGGDGRPVLITHAASFCAKMWEPVIKSLDSDRFRFFALDMRGHGHSQPSSESFSWVEAAHDVVYVSEEILHLANSDEPLVGVGHSMGGTSLVMAEIHKPGLFEKIWAYEPVMFSEDNSEREEITESLAAGARRRKDGFASQTEAKERFSSKPPMQFFNTECLEAFIECGLNQDEVGQVWLSCRPDFEATIYETAGTGVTSRIGDLGCPVDFVVGEGDGDRVPAVLGLVSANEDSQHAVKQVDRANHFSPFIAPAQIAGLIRDWLS